MPKLPRSGRSSAAGEAMVLTHGIKEFLAAHPECLLFNEYGPTEASVGPRSTRSTRPRTGRRSGGHRRRGRPAARRSAPGGPVGAVGEIHLGGAAVAQGYLGRPDETEAAFVNRPGASGRAALPQPRPRALAGRRHPRLPRPVDDQVKIRGHRVEPGETE